MRSYSQWVHWLENRNIMPQIKPGLENTAQVLKEAGLTELINPQNVIHIAGTNGKGTTAKTLEQLLLAQNKSVGLYTSPHLIDTCERIRTNNKNMSQTDFVQLCEQYLPLIEKYNLSHFETLTLFATDQFFKKDKVEYAIFEIGLGGTWDATNAIAHDTSVITTLGLDHIHILGSTLEEIAENKFGIIQKNNRVLHFQYPERIQNLLQEKLKETSAQEILVPPPEFRIQTAQKDFTENDVLPHYILQTPWGEAKLSLFGKRAAENSLIALRTFESLGFDSGLNLAVLEKIQWPARMTLLPQAILSAPVYLSGDHNIQGVESLLEILKHAHYKNVYFILGLSKNRSHTEFIEKLETAERAKIILTRPEFNGIDPVDLKYPFYKTGREALESLREQTQKGDLVVVTGSLYLCGDLMRAASLQR